MTTLSGNPFEALRLIFGIKRDYAAVQVLHGAAGPIWFRGTDENALEEVLIDGEYGFLSDHLGELHAPSVLDVGAHVGTFAIWLLGIQPSARILSIEANPATAALLARNAKPRCEAGHAWNIIHAAASKDDFKTVRLLNNGPSMSSRISQSGEIDVSTLSMRTMIDRLVGPTGTVDLMKVDIEGSEEDFITEAGCLLDRIQTIVIELHPALCDAGRVRMVLEHHFDQVTDMSDPASSKPLLYCRRNHDA